MNKNFLVFLAATILSSPAFAVDSGSGSQLGSITPEAKPRQITPLIIPAPVAKPSAQTSGNGDVKVPAPVLPPAEKMANVREEKEDSEEGFFGSIFKTAPVVVGRSGSAPSRPAPPPARTIDPVLPPAPLPEKAKEEAEPKFVIKNEPMKPQKPAGEVVKIPVPVDKPAVIKKATSPKKETVKIEPKIEVKEKTVQKPAEKVQENKVEETVEAPKKPKKTEMEVKLESPTKVPEEIKDNPVAEKKEPAEVKAEKPSLKAPAKVSLKVEYAKEKDIERFRFKFSRPVAAAVFERFGYYWMVFDADVKADLPEAAKKSALFDNISKVSAQSSEPAVESFTTPAASPLIFRLSLTKEAYANAERNGNDWLVEFDPNIKYEPEKPLEPSEKPEAWEVSAGGVTTKVTAKDEFTNDTIQVFPLLEAGAIAKETKGGNFILEKTVQGVVAKPVGRLETLGDEKDKIKFLKSGQKKIESVAVPEQKDEAVKAPEAAEPARAPEDAKPIFPFMKWSQLKPADYKKAEAQAKKGNISDYGKFLFTQELYPEAAVNLAGEKGVEASYLTGISYFMIGRFNDAIRIFDSTTPPPQSDPNELLLWRVAANQELAKIRPTEANQPEVEGLYLPKAVQNYPNNIQIKLLIPVIERMLDESRYKDAQEYLNVLPKTSMDKEGQSYVKYLQAKIYAGQNKRDRAREIWAEVEAANTDRQSRAKSGYEITMQDYAQGKIKADEAAKKLGDIGILWRGDMFEYRLLNDLAELYLKSGQEYEALKTYKSILTSFPRFPLNLTIAEKMRDIYEKTLEKNFADKEKAFSAVTIYYEFEELKPVGQKGDQISLQLADSLANFDLLEDAAKVLQKYFDSLPAGIQKTEIGTRITILHYLNNKPSEALKTLEASEAEGLPSYLVQERKILQIRCLIELGDLEKAQSMLTSIPDEQANRFMTDIFWKQKKWQELIDVYGLIAQKSDEDIMRLAIANVLLSDNSALRDLRKQYLDRMSKTPYAEKFDFVTDTNNVDYRNLDTSLKLDAAGQVIKEYRDKIKQNPIAENKAVQKGAAPAKDNAPKKDDSAAKPSVTKPIPVTN